MGVILDVGANWGYSVGSIRAAGSDCPVLSFEVSPAFEPCLARIKELDAFGYDFVISGVGKGERRMHDFFIPAVGGTTVAALTTGTIDGLNAGMVENVAGYLETWRPDIEYPELKFLVVNCRIDSIDNLMSEATNDLWHGSVVAIKIDVEGLEGDALWGAKNLVARYRPLLLLEGGMHSVGVRPFLDEFGYIGMRRVANQLAPLESSNDGSHTFFIHHSKLEEYLQKGLLFDG